MPRKPYKYHYIYKTTCLLTNRYYIGIHSTFNIDDGYIGSGKRLRYSIKKYGKENHIKEILEFVKERKELEKKEVDLINEYIDDINCINLTKGGFGFKMNHSETSKNKISKTLSNKTYKDIHGKDRVAIEKEKRSIGVKKSWQNMTEQQIIERKKNMSKAKKIHYEKHPEAKIQKSYKCPHCQKEGYGSVMYKWHFDNCKNK